MTMTPNFDEVQKFGKQQFDAAAAATTNFAKGLQDIAAEAGDYSRKAVAANSAALEKMLGAKTVESAFQIQAEFVKSAYEGFVAQSTKFGDLYSKLASEAFKPVEKAFAAAGK